MTEISIYDLARDQWNASAGGINQWHELDEEEKRDAVDRAYNELHPHKFGAGTAKSDLADWQVAVNKAVREILEHQFPTVCRHWAIAKFLSNLENVGYSQPESFVNAVVRADDATALTFENVFEPESSPVSTHQL